MSSLAARRSRRLRGNLFSIGRNLQNLDLTKGVSTDEGLWITRSRLLTHIQTGDMESAIMPTPLIRTCMNKQELILRAFLALTPS